MLIMRPNGDYGLRDLIADLPNNFVMAEIGCYAGEATTFFAVKASKIYAIDPWEDYTDKSTLISSAQGYENIINMNGVEEEFDKVMAIHPNIVKLKGLSNLIVKEIPDCFLDVVYVDGNHSYNNVLEDIRLWIPKLKPDGIISGHDYGFYDIMEAMRKTIGTPHKTYADCSWAKRLPSKPDEYQYY